MNKKSTKLLTYIYVPITFALLSYCVLALVLSPYYEFISSTLSLVVLNERMRFENESESVYELTDINEGYISLTDLSLPSHGEHYAQLTINRINLETPVYYGDDYVYLRVGAGQYSGSLFPGFKGTTLLAGHNTRVFRPLRNAEVGDIVEFNTSYGNFEYRIYDIQLVHETAYDKYLDLNQTDKDILLMYTCYPFDGLVGLARERLFVFAEKTKGPTIIDGGEHE